MSHTEADRKAFYADIEANQKAEDDAQYAANVQKWLQANPSVGVLNSGKFYVIKHGGMLTVKAFDKIN